MEYSCVRNAKPSIRNLALQMLHSLGLYLQNCGTNINQSFCNLEAMTDFGGSYSRINLKMCRFRLNTKLKLANTIGLSLRFCPEERHPIVTLHLLKTGKNLSLKMIVRTSYQMLIWRCIGWVMVKNKNGQEFYEREDFVGEYVFENEEIDDQFHEYMQAVHQSQQLPDGNKKKFKEEVKQIFGKASEFSKRVIKNLEYKFYSNQPRLSLNCKILKSKKRLKRKTQR